MTDPDPDDSFTYLTPAILISVTCDGCGKEVSPISLHDMCVYNYCESCAPFYEKINPPMKMYNIIQNKKDDRT